MRQRILSELMDDRLEPDISHHVVELDSSPIIIHGSDSESAEENTHNKVNTTTFPDGFPGPSSHRDKSKPELVRKMKTEARIPTSSQAASAADEEISIFIDDRDDAEYRQSHAAGGRGGGSMDPAESESKRTISHKGKSKMGSEKLKYKSTPGSHKSAHKERCRSPKRKSKHRSRRSRSYRSSRSRSRSRDSSLEEEDRYGRRYSVSSRDKHARKQARRKWCEHQSKASDSDQDWSGGETVGQKRSKGMTSTAEDKSGNSNMKRHRKSCSADRDPKSEGIKIVVSRKGKGRLRESTRDSPDRHNKQHKKRLHKHSEEQEQSQRSRQHKKAGVAKSSNEDEKGPEHDERRTCIHDSIEKELLQEAKEIDEEIIASKREILKSALKKERITLLHKNMSARQSSGTDIAYDTNQQMLRDELSKLNAQIVSEKKELLKVAKHIEETKAGLDAD